MTSIRTPERGFPVSEYCARLGRAQGLMAKAGLSALLLTTEAEVRYFTGYLTRFWESPTRPWFLIVPAAGNPVAVIPLIGAAFAMPVRLLDAPLRGWARLRALACRWTLCFGGFRCCVLRKGPIGCPILLVVPGRMGTQM